MKTLVGSYTKAQLERFPKIDESGVGIWTLTAATEEEYLKLWDDPNWKEFLKPRDYKWIRAKHPDLEGY
jgi:hypothetical protein